MSDFHAESVSRRQFMHFLGALGVTGVGVSTFLGLEGMARKAQAAIVPGEPLPPLQAWIPNWTDQIEIWRQLVADWSQLGLTLEVQQGESATWQQQILGEHVMPHFASMSWGGTPNRIDPDFFLTAILHSKAAVKGQSNYGHYRNAAYDEVVDAQRAEMNEEARQKLVREAQAIAAEDNPLLVLFFRDYIQAYNSDLWEDVVPVMGSGIGMPYIPWSYLKMKPKTGRDVVRVTARYDILTLNPFAALGVGDESMIRWIYPTFVFRDENLNIIPWVAESWEVVDPVTVDIVLRDGMKWHDGEPVTVEDVVFTFDYIKKHTFPALGLVKEAVASTEVVGERKVRFHLEKPYAPFISNVLGFVFIAPKHIWEGVDDPLNYPNNECIGAGPFKHKEWQRGEYLFWESNQDFFVKPNIKGVYTLIVPSVENHLGMLEEGQSDILGWYIDPVQAERLSRSEHLTVVAAPTHGFHEIRMNMDLAPMNHPALRKALQHATNRERLLQVVFGGAGTVANNSLISPVLKAWNNPEIPVPEFDIQKARDILGEAGFKWNSSGQLLFPET